MNDQTIAELWAKFDDAFAKAAESLGGPEFLHIYAHPGLSRPDKWSATTGKARDDVAEITDELRQAGNALVALANTLPLVVDKEANVTEMLSAQITDYDDSLWIEVLSPTENASVKLLIGPKEAADFRQSRDFGEDTSDWARAAQTRCIRKTTFDTLDLIEPGAVWFVEWLESQGAQTLYSCEGHPHNFHLVFRGPYELAHAIAEVENLDVYVFRTEGHTEKGLWKIELDYWPDTREERDAGLRQLALNLAKLGPISDHA